MKTFGELPDYSRIWIYQAERDFTDSELTLIKQRSEEFLLQWTSHENPMDAAIEVLYKRFILIGVNEQTAPASGCGIDKSVGFIRRLQSHLGISLLERMSVAYLDQNTVQSCSLKEFGVLLKSGKVNENTLVFNNTVNTKKELASSWKIPLKNSWVFGRIIDSAIKG